LRSLEKFIDPFIEEEIKEYFVAYSGGLDSTVLLSEVNDLLKKKKIGKLKAIHINHNYSKNSKKWEKHCKDFCKSKDIDLLIFNIDFSKIKGASIEEQLRKKRYEIFEKKLSKGGRLFMGHHEDDNIETLVLRLLRGSGTKGARSIPINRKLGKGDIARPLLSLQKENLKLIAKIKVLKFIHDESNDDNSFDRNYIRNLILPVIEKRWPSYRKNLIKFIMNSKESYEVILEQTKEDLSKVVDKKDIYKINISKLLKLSLQRQKNIILYWVDSLNLNSPNSKVLDEILGKFLFASKAKEPKLLWGTKNKKGSVSLSIKKGFLEATPLI
jgi:tRNA(Ile)-lysidine synthase